MLKSGPCSPLRPCIRLAGSRAEGQRGVPVAGGGEEGRREGGRRGEGEEGERGEGAGGRRGRVERERGASVVDAKIYMILLQLGLWLRGQL